MLGLSSVTHMPNTVSPAAMFCFSFLIAVVFMFCCERLIERLLEVSRLIFAVRSEYMSASCITKCSRTGLPAMPETSFFDFHDIAASSSSPYSGFMSANA